MCWLRLRYSRNVRVGECVLGLKWRMLDRQFTSRSTVLVESRIDQARISIARAEPLPARGVGRDSSA